MNAEFLKRVVELTNAERAQRGLDPLTFNPQLAAAAQVHSVNMGMRDFIAHTDPVDRSSAADRVASQGYDYRTVAENVAAGEPTPEQTVQGWMDSPSHRANILSPAVTEIGVGYHFQENDTGNVNFSHYWTQVFGTPMTITTGPNNQASARPETSPSLQPPVEEVAPISDPLPPTPQASGQPPVEEVAPISDPLPPTPQTSGRPEIPAVTPPPTVGVALISEPLAPNNQGFFDLVGTSSVVQLTPGALNGYQFGLRGLAGDDIIIGSTDGELINGNEGRDRIYGTGGNNFLRGGMDDDTIVGADGNDTINGNQGNDVIFGSSGQNLLRGGQGDDSLYGGSGDDVLMGDFGTDVLTGGAGADLFVLRRDTVVGVTNPLEADFITDFNRAEGDRIGLTDGLTENDITYEAIIDLDNNGMNDTVIRIIDTNEILGVVLNINPSDLNGMFVSGSPDILATG
ncbi:CAP domain-containing protein [Oscillatoria acuminata]|uniref:Putative calcium-binding protein n=1 Tax=Oscillatoria acuminata PCC 6304 TaxID=56110 RepID=K9TCX8_9CYAN|nr:CAP domain-containing protein [Oscillatoria acuminata]AFY80747.1 putative calcium-binding protein [Oscillatoria acuminata PCC 6304]